MNRPVPAAAHETNRNRDEEPWRDELSRALGSTAFPCSSEDAAVNLLRAHAPSRLIRRVSVAPPQMRFASPNSLLAYIEEHSPREQQSTPVSDVGAKDQHDIRLQQIIDDLTRDHHSQSRDRVVCELSRRIAQHRLPAEPQSWLDAVADSVISGNAYVVTATTAEACDVPPPSSYRPGEIVK